MNELKYITFIPYGFNDTINGKRAIVFNGMLSHKVIGEAIEHEKGKLVSAGFCQVKGDDVYVFGNSTSLGLESDIEDVLIIYKTLFCRNIPFDYLKI